MKSAAAWLARTGWPCTRLRSFLSCRSRAAAARCSARRMWSSRGKTLPSRGRCGPIWRTRALWPHCCVLIQPVIPNARGLRWGSPSCFAREFCGQIQVGTATSHLQSWFRRSEPPAAPSLTWAMKTTNYSSTGLSRVRLDMIAFVLSSSEGTAARLAGNEPAFSKAPIADRAAT